MCLTDNTSGGETKPPTTAFLFICLNCKKKKKNAGNGISETLDLKIKTKGVPKVTFSFSYTQRVGFGSRVWLIPTLCEIRRIAVLKFHDTDPYSSRIQTYPDVPCSKTCDGLNPWHEKSDFRIRH